MKISFYGAAGEVTGSCSLLETGRARVLVDFGLHQGGKDAEKKNRRLPPIHPGSLDAVVLTHGHLDHCGRLPLLVRGKKTYPGSVYMTRSSTPLAELILRDAAHIQEMDAQRTNRRRLRAGKRAVAPLYTKQDAERVISRFVGVPYEQEHEVAPGVTARFLDAGHILGSASVLVRAREADGTERSVLFSGDIGVEGTPVLRDPWVPTNDARADLVVLESTYGDRDHKDIQPTLDELAEIVSTVARTGGKVIIPAFAVGRSQTLLYHMGQLVRAGRIPPVNVYLDSPMAASATQMYRSHPGVFDEETNALLGAGEKPLVWEGVRITQSADESRRLNNRTDGIVVISASGMCTGGRILHHLKHGLWRDNVHVVFCGYQARGTLGRRLVDGAKDLRIMGERIAVKAHIHTLGGFSAHAGRSALLRWAGAVAGWSPRLVLNHGEDKPREQLAQGIRDAYGIEARLPLWGDQQEV